VKSCAEAAPAAPNVVMSATDEAASHPRIATSLTPGQVSPA
jgi:hypothetical protein